MLRVWEVRGNGDIGNLKNGVDLEFGGDERELIKRY